jgi:PAS domain S-box-containing protein
VEQVVDQMPGGVAIVEAESGRIVYANARAHELVDRLGKSMPEELSDEFEIFHLDGRPYRREEWPVVRSVTSGEHVLDEEYFCVIPEGGRLIIRCSASPICDARGVIIAGVLVMNDVTEEKRAAEQLAHHASLLDIVEDAVVGTDAEFRLTVWNRGAEQLYGYAAGEVLGRDARDVASSEGDSSRLELERELLDGARTRTEITAYRKDGTPVEVELIALAVRDEKGEITGYIGVHRDITERKRLEETIAEVRESERTRIARDLHDEALQELTDALILADRGASAGLPTDAAERLAWALRRVAQQLRAAIYDLRLVEHESRSFPEALHALVAAHRASAVDCEIDLDDAAAIPAAVRDRQTEVLRIVGEALTNARRHSGAHHIRVLTCGAEDGLRIDVTDDGRGFDPTGRSAAAGTGIQGMRERAALLNGTLDIRSSPGAGTAVRLQLGPPDDDQAGADPARILLVDDHTAVREAIAGMVERELDLTVVGQAGSLAEARAMLGDVDVAVVDLGLPDGYGGDLIRELHQVNPRARALVLSASLDPVQISRATESGASATLEKTAPLDELVESIRRLHRAQAGWTEPGHPRTGTDR